MYSTFVVLNESWFPFLREFLLVLLYFTLFLSVFYLSVGSSRFIWLCLIRFFLALLAVVVFFSSFDYLSYAF